MGQTDENFRLKLKNTTKQLAKLTEQRIQNVYYLFIQPWTHVRMFSFCMFVTKVDN